MSSYIKKFAPNTSEQSIAETAALLAKKPKRQGSNQCLEDLDKDTSTIQSKVKNPAQEEKTPSSSELSDAQKEMEAEQKKQRELQKKKDIEETFAFLTRKPKRQGSNQL